VYPYAMKSKVIKLNKILHMIEEEKEGRMKEWMKS